MINNVKGIIFTAIGSLIGLGVSKKVTDVLNDKFNPELAEEKQAMKDTTMAALTTVFKTGSDAETTETEDNIIDTTATEQEASE